ERARARRATVADRSTADHPTGGQVNERRSNDRRRGSRPLLAGAVIVAGAVAGVGDRASAATVATFASGVLTMVGDGADNTITFSRNAAWAILVNNGAIAVVGGSPTVANT